MQIRWDFDIANLQQYHDNNTLPHIPCFHGKIQENLCKSREAVTVFLQNQRGDCFLLQYATIVLSVCRYHASAQNQLRLICLSIRYQRQ